jgi:hypothetical protein
MSYPGKMRTDGLCDAPAVEIPARQLLGAACARGGAACPLFATQAEASELLARLHGNAALSVRLTSAADGIPHYTRLAAGDYAALDGEGVRHRKRDLDVLQRLGLAPGDTRRARHLYELLFERVETPWGICAHATSNWEGCALARSGAYERVRAKGWSAMVCSRPAAEQAAARQLSVERVRHDPVLCLRPHHLLCMSCWVGDTGGTGVREHDTLDEVYRRICRDPEVEIMLVEGCCEACHCCEGFHPDTGRCVHAGGLIRDYKKDLDVFQKLGLLPGARLRAHVLLRLLYERIPSTRDVCGYGTGTATAEEWTVCGGPDGHAGYAKARARALAEGDGDQPAG